jgi:formylmethanofuran dehydrogenase subunit E
MNLRSLKDQTVIHWELYSISLKSWSQCYEKFRANLHHSLFKFSEITVDGVLSPKEMCRIVRVECADCGEMSGES